MDIVPSRPARLAALLGSLATLRKGAYVITGDEGALLVHPSMDEAAFLASLETYPAGRAFLATIRRDMSFIYGRYVRPIIEVYERLGFDQPFLVVPGDNRRSLPLPSFCKSAPAGAAGNGVLFPLNKERHFAGVDRALRDSLPFEEKDDRLVWRGAMTGKFKSSIGSVDFGARYHVARFNAAVSRPDIDLGYTNLIDKDLFDPAGDYAAAEASQKAPLSIDEQLGNKYILCLEGNDVASGLKWALASNSVVLMPHPQFQSWACETLLLPFIHYVPVRPDLSNLVEQLEWCRQNTERCTRIADWSRRFMQPFLNDDATAYLTDTLARTYARRIVLRGAPECEIEALLSRYG